MNFDRKNLLAKYRLVGLQSLILWSLPLLVAQWLLCTSVIAQQTFPLFPKYQVLGIVYAPPGSASSVTYGQSTMVGSGHSIVSASTSTTTQTQSQTSGFSLFGFGSSTTTTNSDSWVSNYMNSSSQSLQTTSGNSISTMGPVSSALGVNHDNDIIYIWLNPVMNTQLLPPQGSGSSTIYPIQWLGYQFNSCDLSDTQDQVNFYQLMNGCDPNQYPFPDIVGIPVWCLKNPFYPAPSCSQWLTYTSRSWDLVPWGTDPVTGVPLGPGLTLQDYADILKADPFVTQTLVADNIQPSQSPYVNPCHAAYGVNFDPNDKEVIPDSTHFSLPYSNTAWPVNYCGNTGAGITAGLTQARFDAFDTVQYPEPGVNGQPQTYSGTLSNMTTSSTGTSSTDTHTHSYDKNHTTSFAFTVSYGPPGGSWGSVGVSALSAGFNFGSSSGTGWSYSDGQTLGYTTTTSQTNSASFAITGPALSDNYTGPTTFNVYKDNVYGTFAFYSDLQHVVSPVQLISNGFNTAIGVAFTGGTAFGNATVGATPPAAKNVTLTNNSPYLMTMVAPAMTFSDPGFQIPAGSDNCSNALLGYVGNTLGLPISCTMQVQFVPVVTDAPNSLVASYPVSAYVIAAGTENVSSYQNILVTNTVMAVQGPNLETATTVSGTAFPAATTCTTVTPFCDTGATLTPAPASFTVNVGSTTPEAFTFKNYYNVPVTVNASPNGVILSSTTDYSVPAATDNCSGHVIAALATCAVTVQTTIPSTFPAGSSNLLNTKVTVAGTVQGGNMTLPATASSAISTTVVGIGLSPVSGTTSEVTITGHGAGTTYTPLTVTVTNTSTSTLTLTSLTATSPMSASLVTCKLNTAMAAGASCTINVQVFGSCTVTTSPCIYPGTFSVNGTLGTTGNPSIAGTGSVTGVVVDVNAGSIAFSGTEQSQTVTTPATPATGKITVKGSVASPFTGLKHVEVTVGAFTAEAFYGKAATADIVAKSLAAKINVSGSPVKATINGNVLTLTSRVAGTKGNLTFSTTGTGDFGFAPKVGSLTGGADAVTTTKYDGGSVSAVVASVSGTAKWGKSSTIHSIAAGIAKSLNAGANGAFTATAVGGAVVITPASNTPAAPALNVSVQDSMGFSPASFAASTN